MTSYSISIRGYSNCCWGNIPNKHFLIRQYLIVRFRIPFIRSILITLKKLFTGIPKRSLLKKEVPERRHERVREIFFATLYQWEEETLLLVAVTFAEVTCQNISTHGSQNPRLHGHSRPGLELGVWPQFSEWNRDLLGHHRKRHGGYCWRNWTRFTGNFLYATVNWWIDKNSFLTHLTMSRRLTQILACVTHLPIFFCQYAVA